ncbi:hypothetical protein HUJ05_004599 [Dendroctonus ponderosae]|nr:hypothetical protein HUJ05_004599 [Dendroctonus ponderosae]
MRLRNVKYLKQTINNKIIKDHPDSFHFPYLKNPNQTKVAKESEEGLIEDDDSQSSIAKDTIILRSTIDISIITIDVLRKAALLMAIHCMKHEHQKTHDPEYKKDEFLCCFCSKILTHVKSYKVHMKSHTGEAVASVCDICDI